MPHDFFAWILRGISEEVARVLREAWKTRVKRLNSSVNMIKDKREKGYLHALANIDLFPLERALF